LSRWRRNRAGFTLIEVVVALAVVAAMLAAIGSLMAVSMRGARSIDQRLAFRETLRAFMTTRADSRDIVEGSTSGTMGRYQWRVDVAPFIADFVDPRLPTPWRPEIVAVTMRSPSGQVLHVQTVRLRPEAR
jgi:general secretion pathway protein I